MKKYGLLAVLITLVADQAAKLAIVHVWMNPPSVVPVTPFFNLVLAWNTGVSFSLFASSEETRLWTLIAVTGMIAIVLFFWMLKEKNLITVIALGMIVGGAIGNLIDRFVYGAVIDYLQFYVGTFYWPAFNIADSAICVAAGLIVLDSFSVFKRKV